jgi:hypothetical protein
MLIIIIIIKTHTHTHTHTHTRTRVSPMPLFANSVDTKLHIWKGIQECTNTGS